MSTNNTTANAVQLEITPDAESPEKFLDDKDLWSDLIDSINQNFVMEVESSHENDEQGDFNQMRKAD